MIVDFQHHYVPLEIARRYGFRGGRLIVMKDGAPWMTLHDKLCDIEAQIADMEVAGVDLAVLSCITAWSADLEECREVNTAIARVCERYPRRFAGLAHVPILEGGTALDELRRSVHDLGLRGISISSHVDGVPLDAPQLYPLYAAAVELDIPICVHPPMRPQGYDLLGEYDLHRVIGREFDLVVAATRLIYGGVFDRFPGLKVVVAHFGGGVMAIRERLTPDRDWGDGPRLARSFDDYFGLLYFDMAGFKGGRYALRCALTAVHPSRLVFATDSPQDFASTPQRIREYVAEVGRQSPDAESARWMLGENAMRLLRLDAIPTP